MKNKNRKYLDIEIFACLIQDNLVSVKGQYANRQLVSKNLFKEIIFKTNNLEGSIDKYIELLKKGEV